MFEKPKYQNKALIEIAIDDIKCTAHAQDVVTVTTRMLSIYAVDFALGHPPNTIGESISYSFFQVPSPTAHTVEKRKKYDGKSGSK